MIEIGRIAIKTAGRDAGRECVVVDIIDNTYVLIDGNVRRRKCNILHLEPTQQIIKIRKNASHEDIAAEFKSLGFGVWETKPKEGKEQPKKERKDKAKTAEKAAKGKKEKKAPKEDKKAVKKEDKKEPKKKAVKKK